MVYAELEGDQLTDEEIIRQCILLLLAGNITTTDLIGNAVKALVDHPRELAKLRADESLLANVVEETLRYESPVTVSGRIANRDLEIGGVTIRQGEDISVMLAAANRDPEIYPDPDRFDVTRADTPSSVLWRRTAFLSRLASRTARGAGGAAGLAEPLQRAHRCGRRVRVRATPTFRGLARLTLDAVC